MKLCHYALIFSFLKQIPLHGIIATLLSEHLVVWIFFLCGRCQRLHLTLITRCKGGNFTDNVWPIDDTRNGIIPPAI